MVGSKIAASMASVGLRTSRMGVKMSTKSIRAYSTTSPIRSSLQRCVPLNAPLYNVKGGYGFMQKGGYGAIMRSFSASAVSRHGHLDPPKPGEGYVYSDKDFDAIK